MQHDLLLSKALLLKIAARQPVGQPVTSEIARLKSLAGAIGGNHQLLRERFAARDSVAGGLGPVGTARHAAMRQEYLAFLDEYLAVIAALPNDSVPAHLLDSLKSRLESMLPEHPTPLLGALPYRHLRWPAQPSATAPLLTPAYLGGNRTVSAADLAGSQEAPITPEIAALAQSLNWSPVEIYGWVKNNIKSEWYWGVMKGAEETLHQRSGNDADQAALLVALLRAAGYPARFVRGTIEFFPDPAGILAQTGVADVPALAGFFQKAGIPCQPVIKGGVMANLQIEHIWVEAEIPYANYRGVVLDDRGKSWLALDTQIKSAGVTVNHPNDLPVGVDLAGLRDQYLATARPESPLEFLRGAYTAAAGDYDGLLHRREVNPEELQILPASLQFEKVAVVGEYTSLPESLTHRVRFAASHGDTILFDSALPLADLSNRSLAITYEPSTVEDQEIINSYGGLANTPAYLVHLRPVLSVDGERTLIGRSGLPVGSDFQLTVELIAPNNHSERIENSLIIGNLAVLGLVAQEAVLPPEMAAADKTAERLLYERALDYIDRWNQAEAELAALLNLPLLRPLPTLVTVGGVAEVTWLLDTPHGFEWRGVYIDADFRAVELAGSDAAKLRLFMQLASLQGSVLEERVLSEGFGVAAVSTAKLLGLSNAEGVALLELNQANLDVELPALGLATNVAEDIELAVGQGLRVTIPPGLSLHEDWQGIGYRKEDPASGEAGWMLSGQIAGGMTALNPKRWMELFLDTLVNPYSEPPNRDPSAAVNIQVLSTTATRGGTVGQPLPEDLEVLVTDRNHKPVQGAQVTFSVKAGGGSLRISGSIGQGKDQMTVNTDYTGVARAELLLGQRTSANPYLVRQYPADKYDQMAGQNIVAATLASGAIGTTASPPFTVWGFPDEPKRIVKAQGEDRTALPNSFGGLLIATVVDRYDNPVANQDLTFTVLPSESTVNGVVLPSGAANFRNLTLSDPQQCADPLPAENSCGGLAQFTQKTTYRGSTVGALLGNTTGTKYRIRAGITHLDDLSEPIAEEFNLYSTGARYSCPDDPLLGNTNCDDPTGKLLPPGLYMQLVDNSLNSQALPTAQVGKPLLNPIKVKLFQLEDDFTQESYPDIDERDNPVIRWRARATGIVNYRPVTDGTVTFKALDEGGSIGPTQNLGGGLYQAAYTAGSNPGPQRIEIEGSATLNVPEFFVENYPGGVVATMTKGYPGVIGSQSIELKSGQYVLFHPNVFLPKPEPVIFTPDGGTAQIQLVYGVEVKPAQPAYTALIDANGVLLEDLRIDYQILPANYQAGSARVEINERLPGGNWVPLAYIDSERSGAGFGTLAQGSMLKPNAEYVARVILNYMTNEEIRSNDIQLIPGVVRIVSDDAERRDMLGVATDGVSTIRLRLEVQPGWESLPQFDWGITDADLPGSTVGTGSLLNGAGGLASTVPVIFDAGGVAEVVYRAPQNFVRFGTGTDNETADKSRPERFIQIKLGNSGTGLPKITLKRPPVLLVHGLWGGPKTWKEFVQKINPHGEFTIQLADYKSTNAASIASNVDEILRSIETVLQSSRGNEIAATQVDVIAHSMGGLLVREYCRQNPAGCTQNIRKFITIDTPHAGSELASLIVETNQTPTGSCYDLLGKIDNTVGMSIWSDPARENIEGALIDLVPGSQALQNLATAASKPWVTVVGTTQTGLQPFIFSHDHDLNLLWQGIWLSCDKVPDPTFWGWFGSNQPVFSGENDRIVSKSSQENMSVNRFLVTEVDHLSVLRSQSVVDSITTIIGH